MMMGADFYWEVFRNTGNPKAYILYKETQETEDSTNKEE